MNKLQVLTEMVEKFQCPGCVAGSDSKCGRFSMKQLADGVGRCESHVVGTHAMPGGHMILGMPKGFNKTKRQYVEQPRFKGDMDTANQADIRLRVDSSSVEFNNLNIPVWALERDGYLFVRTYSPRIDHGCIDVIKDGKRAELVPNVLDVATFENDID